MKNTKWKYIVKTLIAVSVLSALLVSMNGCKKKKPDTTEPSSTGETVAETTDTVETTIANADSTETTTETTGPAETTTETTVALCEHVWGAPIVDDPSNCTREGSRHKECILCNEKGPAEAIPMTAHAPSEWKGTKATCTQEGAMYQECTQCDKKLATIVVDKADHRTYPVKGENYTVGYVCSACGTIVQDQYKIPAEGTVHYIVENGTITKLENWTGSELIIPEKIGGQTITGIGKEAFAGRASIKTVYIPKTVTEIGDKAFSGCSALTKIVYGGSVMEWTTSVVKAAQWNQNTGNYQIHCNNRILSK